MDTRRDLAHFLLLFGIFVALNCLTESKTDQNDVESMYQTMSDRKSALLQHPQEVEKMKQECRSEIDLLMKEHAEQISSLKQEIVDLGLEHKIQIREVKQEMITLREESQIQVQQLNKEIDTLRLEHDLQIQELKQSIVSPAKENVNNYGKEDDNITTIYSSLPEYEKDEDLYGTENRHLLADQLMSFSRKMKGTQKSRIISRQAETTDHIAFFAKLSADSLNMGSNQVIKFENIVTNIGNAYDSSIGVFRAPRAGVYLFSTTITTYHTVSGHIRIFINDVPETISLLNGAENTWDENSQTIIVNLKQGDDVTVRSTTLGHGVRGGNHCLFSGVLLFEEVGQEAIVG